MTDKNEIRKKSNIPVIGSFKPSPQLRGSLEEAKKCQEYFEQEKYIDYLISINKVYLGESGNITSPEIHIDSWLDEGEFAPEEKFLDLGESTRGGVQASLDWVEGKVKKHIGIRLSYYNSANCFGLYLLGSIKSRERKGTTVFVGKSISRNFWLNPISRTPKDIDDLLLTFTSELLDSGILQKL